MITRTNRQPVALSERYPDAPCNYYHEESGGRYPALPAAQSKTTSMLATPAKTTPMLATSNYYQAGDAKSPRPKKTGPERRSARGRTRPEGRRVYKKYGTNSAARAQTLIVIKRQ